MKCANISRMQIIVLFFLLLIGVEYLVYFLNLVLIKNSHIYYDFGSFIASGQLANSGENPYSDNSALIFRAAFAGNGISGSAPNLNPPISILFFQQIANIDPYLSTLVWRIFSLLFYLAALYLLNVAYPVEYKFTLLRWVWALGLAGFWHTIELGQLYTFILLILVLIWVLMKQQRWILAGVFLGILIAIKPNFVVWAFLLLLAGNWRTFFSAGATATLISGFPILVYGPRIYQQWLAASSIFTPNLLLFPANNSFQSLTARFGYPTVGIGISLFVVLGIAAYVHRSRPGMKALSTLGIIISLLSSPIAWTGYTILTLPYFFSEERWHWSLGLVAVIFMIPFNVVLWFFELSFLNSVIFGWFYGWGLLGLLFSALFARKDSI